MKEKLFYKGKLAAPLGIVKTLLKFSQSLQKIQKMKKPNAKFVIMCLNLKA